MIEEVGTTTEGDLVINIGPQHPSTHGVLHLVITLNGETIKNQKNQSEEVVSDVKLYPAWTYGFYSAFIGISFLRISGSFDYKLRN